MLDAGCWMLDAGCWLLVAGCWMPVAGKCRPLNSEGDSRGGRAPPSCARPVACDPWRAVRLGPTAACALVPRIERG
ncbi:hypothetical protein [Burkholderia pseudomallei]|uniref:hypothetical protein n=1 Tax=Burkholderia pseudomallei TaxID=28450 RepID=UPI0009B24F04|nr:hypothetical protein [Burkholderia pseudomallei]